MSLQVTLVARADYLAPPLKAPLMGGVVRAGFPSPADDYVEVELDLVAHLIQQPEAT